MLMVVFGAGASYDSFSDYPPETGAEMDRRPPLANQLFELRFANTIEQFPQCQPIIRHLRQQGSDLAPNVEQVLQKFQDQAGRDPERYIQLAAIRYYLQTILWNCQTQWRQVTHGATNYATILDQIRRYHQRHQNERICLATFNYDTLLEEALHVVRVKTKVISDYIASDYQIIKLHGSINWGREVNNDIPDIEKLSEMQVASELIDNAAELKISDSYHITSNPPRQAPFVNRPPRLGIQKAIQPIRPPLLFPALTIPVENKSEYECPKEHSQTMERNLPRVTDLMIIGWRASEKPFLKSLGSSLERDTRILVISSSREKAIGLVGKMKDAGITGNFSTANGGFSNSTRIGGEVESFLEV